MNLTPHIINKPKKQYYTAEEWEIILRVLTLLRYSLCSIVQIEEARKVLQMAMLMGLISELYLLQIHPSKRTIHSFPKKITLNQVTTQHILIANEVILRMIH